MTAGRKLVFVWENIGPTHADRLDALGSAAGGPDRVVAIAMRARSKSYGWKREDGEFFATRTLFGAHEKLTYPALAWRTIREGHKLGKADIFFCHYSEWPVLVAAWTLRLFGARCFALVDSKFDDYPRKLSKELLKWLFLSPYRGVLTASLRSRDYLRFFGFAPERLALGYDTLSVDRIAALAGSPPAPEGTPFAERDFVVVARHVPKKNIATAIEAYALWRERTARPRALHLCGSGPLEAELREQVERLGLTGDVHFHGFVQTDEVARQLARSLCLLLPSVEEQYGLVVIEAQALGLPVLVSRNAGACDLLVDDGVNGFTLDPTRAESWAALMLLLSEDEARWRSFATAARESRYRGDCRHFVEGVLQLTGS